jgi:RHO1 GDP-GTP exchange protein 1/2
LPRNNTGILTPISPAVLKSDFRLGYEIYIKHYPLSESHHRNQLKRNPAYQNFVQSVSNDPRIRKRDLITFLSRPVTRLPRLNLLLSQILKLTEKDHDHPDLETLPIILEVLSSCIKSTQPGIEAAESKVKFWEMCESLVYQKGEIMVCIEYCGLDPWLICIR